MKIYKLGVQTMSSFMSWGTLSCLRVLSGAECVGTTARCDTLLPRMSAIGLGSLAVVEQLPQPHSWQNGRFFSNNFGDDLKSVSMSFALLFHGITQPSAA